MSLSPSVEILVVCTANLRRSQIAALQLRRLLSSWPELTVSSAGLDAVDGMPLESRFVTELTAAGFRTSELRSRRLVPEQVESATLILTAESAHAQRIALSAPSATARIFTLKQFARIALAAQSHRPGLVGASATERLAQLMAEAPNLRRTSRGSSAGADDITDVGRVTRRTARNLIRAVQEPVDQLSSALVIQR